MTEEQREASRARKRKWYAANREAERIRDRSRKIKRRVANIENAREQERNYARKRYHADIVAARKYSREAARKWYTANPDAKRKYRQANPEVKRASEQRRRASLKTSTAGAPTAKQLKALLALPCYYCGDPAAHVDHYIPLARGGTHTLANLVPACAPCNLSKHAKMPQVWKGRSA